MEQVDASIARYLRALDRADREESDIAEAKSFTALNLLPSIATTARVNSPSWRHNTTNWEHTARIAPPLHAVEIAVEIDLQ
jgi:hypothetical protein